MQARNFRKVFKTLQRMGPAFGTWVLIVSSLVKVATSYGDCDLIRLTSPIGSELRSYESAGMLKLRDDSGGLSANYTLHSLSTGTYKLGLLLHGDLTDALEDSLDTAQNEQWEAAHIPVSIGSPSSVGMSGRAVGLDLIPSVGLSFHMGRAIVLLHGPQIVAACIIGYTETDDIPFRPFHEHPRHHRGLFLGFAGGLAVAVVIAAIAFVAVRLHRFRRNKLARHEQPSWGLPICSPLSAQEVGGPSLELHITPQKNVIAPGEGRM